MVVEFARHAPRLFLRGLRSKALYALGLFSALRPGAGWSPALVVMWAGAALGIAGVIRSRDRPPLWWLPAAIAASHFSAVVVIFPDVYGDRLILPLYVLLIPYAARLAAPLFPGGQSDAAAGARLS